MKTITVNLYQFDELSDQAKDRAVEWFATDCPEYNWWESVYEDAKTVGVNIRESNIDRGTIRSTADGRETARLILENHGPDCDTYKLAQAFNTDYANLVKRFSGKFPDQVDEDHEYEFDKEADELEAAFNKEIGEEYMSLLRQEYEYLTSRECIEENIRENGYTFTADGKRHN